MTAPVQLLTIGLDEAQVDPGVLTQFEKLQAAGTIRVLDVLFINHRDDGSVDSVERIDAGRMRFDGSLLTRLLTADAADAEPSPDAAWSIEGVVPRGEIAALVLIEHLWAAPLVEAMAASGGRMFDEFWLTSEDCQVLDAMLADR